MGPVVGLGDEAVEEGALGKAVGGAGAETDDRLILVCPASGQVHAAAKA